MTATVVRAAKPTSVRPGDAALVLADGTIDGLRRRRLRAGVGAAARRARAGDRRGRAAAAAARAPPATASRDARRRRRRAQPVPERRLAGDLPRPAAAPRRASSSWATRRSRARWRTSRAPPATTSRARGGDVAPARRDAALIVASHGNDEEARARARRCEAGVGYVGARGQPKRGAAVRDVARRRRRAARARSTRPPGSTSARARRPTSRSRSSPRSSPSARRTRRRPRRRRVAVAIDPVCGMEVAVSDASRPPRPRRRARLLLLRGLPRRPTRREHAAAR